MNIGDTVFHTMREKTGKITALGTLPNTFVVEGIGLASAQWLTLSKPTKTPAFLRTAKLTPEIGNFIDYLRTPEAKCSLYLEARNPDHADAIKDQYAQMTEEELTEGSGFNIAPFTANKQGSEGSVRFTALPEYLQDIKKVLSPDGQGHINRIGFVWLLVREGFRVAR